MGTQLGGAAAVLPNFALLLLDGRGEEEIREYFWRWKEVMRLQGLILLLLTLE